MDGGAIRPRPKGINSNADGIDPIGGLRIDRLHAACVSGTLYADHIGKDVIERDHILTTSLREKNLEMKTKKTFCN